jgi:hypothetical protein
LRRWPVTLVGVGVVTLWMLMATGVLHANDVPRVLRVPVYLTRLPFILVEGAMWGAEVTTAQRVIDFLAMPLMLAPYIMLDLGLHRVVLLCQRLARHNSTA